MSQATSPATGQSYGLERVYRVLDSPARRSLPSRPESRLRWGLGLRYDAGHRQVWARWRILRDIRVSNDRVCRLRRENALLSPHRVLQGTPSRHDGSIQAKAPNRIWGTDGLRIQTVEDGWVWVFSAVDHFDAGVVGHRFAARQPIAQGGRRNSVPPAPMPARA